VFEPEEVALRVRVPAILLVFLIREGRVESSGVVVGWGAEALEGLGVGEEIKTLSMLKREVEAPSELESSRRLDDGGLKEFKMASRASLPESVREGRVPETSEEEIESNP
jgi:hypothetical protein